MKIGLISSIVVACCVVCLWQWLAFTQESAKPQPKSVSPDGKWELLAGPHEQDDFVIAKVGSGETSVVLSEEEYVDGLAAAMGRAPGYANILWAPDSTRFAFNLQPIKGYQTVQFYQLDGNAWRKLEPLESQAAMMEPIDRSMANQKNKMKQKLKLSSDDEGWPVMSSWQVRKWIDPSTVLLYAHRRAKFELKNAAEEAKVSFFFTLKFDHAGNWKVARMFEVPEQGVSGLNEEESKEINRIESENREVRSK
jgi:hypothetical protein